MRKKPATIIEKLQKGMAEAVEVGECLEWQGKMGNKKTIPVVQSREGMKYNAEYSVPRLLWEREKGPIPAGKLVYRKCCNNACVELSHLAVGTRAQWIENRRKRGLTKHTAAHIVNLTQGARRRQTTINSLEKAREVRALLSEHSRDEVASLTGVSRAMVDEIARGRAWKDHSNPFAGLLAANDNRRAA
jgi:hypothetical protein